jgi:hypothetical protein
LGDDILNVTQDLSADEIAWKQGRQIAVIGEEILFVQKVTALGGSSYRLDGVVRARYDTVRAAHAIGAKVFVFADDLYEALSDGLVTPFADLFLKQQPNANGFAFDLSLVLPTNKVLKGKGVVPMEPGCLRVTAPRKGAASFKTTEDVAFAWNYRSTELISTGAGLFPAGDAYGDAAVRGTFEVEVYDTTDVLVATYNVGTATVFVYDNADIQTDLGSEESFYVKLRNINGGLRSDPVQLNITFIS